MTYKNDKTYLIKEIKAILYDKNTISLNFVGSFYEKFDDSFSDIDVVLIQKNIFKEDILKKISNLKKLKLENTSYANKKIIINNNFGPLKYYNFNSITIHLMIYDLKNHIRHTVESPFTCYDWEKTKIFFGISLKSLSPVSVLSLNDFLDSRRGILDYLSDLQKKKISFRKYIFTSQSRYYQRKYYKKINYIEQIEYTYHIIYFLTKNFVKFIKQKNINPSEYIFKKYFLLITNDFELYLQFKLIKNIKLRKNSLKIKSPVKIAEFFLKKYFNFINDLKHNCNIKFIRHAKPSYGDGTFLGIRRDPDVQKNTSFFLSTNFNTVYVSALLRSINTAKKSNLLFKKIIINPNLNEIDYGSLDGFKYSDIKKNFPSLNNKWNNNKYSKFPLGEGYKCLALRQNKFLNLLKKDLKDEKIKNVLVITHNVWLRVLIGKTLIIPMTKWHLIDISYLNGLEFIYINKQLYPNFNRQKMYKLILHSVYD